MAEDGKKEEFQLFRNFNKLTMFAKTPGVERGNARLQWGMRDLAPRITVFTNDPNDQGANKGMIYAGFNAETFMIFLELLKQVANSEEVEIRHKIDTYGMRFEDNVRTNDRILVSELWFGKDRDGIIWLSLIAPDRPKIRFNFTISDWHAIYRTDGNRFSEKDASKLAALVTVDILRNVYLHVFGTNFDTETYQSKLNAEKRNKRLTNKDRKEIQTEIRAERQEKFAESKPDSSGLNFEDVMY